MCQSLCCAGRSCCGACCGCLGKCGVPAKNFPRVAYVICDIIFMMIAFILMYTLKPLAENWSWFECNDISGGGSTCFGVSSILRMSFSLFLFHLVMLIFLLPRLGCSEALHDGLWSLKYLLLILCFIGVFFMPASFFVYWAQICRAGSVLWLVLQAYFIGNVAYLWNDQLDKKLNHKDGGAYAQCMVIGFSVFTTLACLCWHIFMWVWFKDCPVSVFSLVITLIASVFLTYAGWEKACGCVTFRKDATIFSTSIMVAYLTYASWTTLTSFDNVCNPFIYSVGASVLQVIVGLVPTIICIVAIAVASESNEVKGAGEEKKMHSALEGVVSEKVDEEAKPKTVEKEEAAVFPVTLATILYQAILLVASLYYGMLFSDWGEAIITEGEGDQYYGSPDFTYWTKQVTSWIAIVFFILSVSINVCCKGRVF